MHLPEGDTGEMLRARGAALAVSGIEAPALRIAFLLVARAHHRLDELARCIEAAVWGPTTRRETPELWICLLSASGDQASLLLLDTGKLVASLSSSPASRSETDILRFVQQHAGLATAPPPLRTAPPPKFASVKACMQDALRTGRISVDASDALFVLHEDAPLLLPHSNTTREERVEASRWRRTIWAFGVHEDFNKEIADAVSVLGEGLPRTSLARVSLGPVALQSSACIHTALGLLRCAAPSRPAAAYASLATPSTRDGQIFRLRPTPDLELQIRCVPNRGSVHYWVALPAGVGAESRLSQMVCVAGIWASKSAYRAADTRITLVEPGPAGRVITFDRSLLDFMPRDEADGKAPNQKNVILAITRYIEANPGCSHPTLRDAFAAYTRKQARVLALRVEDGAPFLPDAPEIRPSVPNPREIPLHAFIGPGGGSVFPEDLTEIFTPPPQAAAVVGGAPPGGAPPSPSPSTSAPTPTPLGTETRIPGAGDTPAGGVSAVVLEASIRGTPVGLPDGSGLTRAVALLQALHSLARLKPIVKSYGSGGGGGDGERGSATPPHAALPLKTVSELRAFCRDVLSLGDLPEKIPRDTICDVEGNTEVKVTGVVTATRAQGNVCFIGLMDPETCERAQVLANLRVWDAKRTHSLRSLASGDLLTVAGVMCHTTQGRLSLLAQHLVAVEAAEPVFQKTVSVITTPNPPTADPNTPPGYAVCGKPSGMLTHPTSTMRAVERPTACCEASRLIGRRVYPTHTVEKDTSGVCLYAGSAREAEAVAVDVKAAEKMFVVIAVSAEGAAASLPAEGEAWSCDEPLKEVVRDGKVKKRRHANRVAFPASTDFRCVAAVPAARAVVLTAVPHTAGTRQIRRHLALRNLFVVGDHLQGNGVSNKTFMRTYAYRETAIHLLRITMPGGGGGGGGGRCHIAPYPPALRTLICAMPCNAAAVLALQDPPQAVEAAGR